MHSLRQPPEIIAALTVSRPVWVERRH